MTTFPSLGAVSIGWRMEKVAFSPNYGRYIDSIEPGRVLKYLVWVAPLRTPRADAALTANRYARMCGARHQLTAFGTAMRRFAAFALAERLRSSPSARPPRTNAPDNAVLARKRDAPDGRRDAKVGKVSSA